MRLEKLFEVNNAKVKVYNSNRLGDHVDTRDGHPDFWKRVIGFNVSSSCFNCEYMRASISTPENCGVCDNKVNIAALKNEVGIVDLDAKLSIIVPFEGICKRWQES